MWRVFLIINLVLSLNIYGQDGKDDWNTQYPAEEHKDVLTSSSTKKDIAILKNSLIKVSIPINYVKSYIVNNEVSNEFREKVIMAENSGSNKITGYVLGTIAAIETIDNNTSEIINKLVDINYKITEQRAIYNAGKNKSMLLVNPLEFDMTFKSTNTYYGFSFNGRVTMRDVKSIKAEDNNGQEVCIDNGWNSLNSEKDYLTGINFNITKSYKNTSIELGISLNTETPDSFSKAFRAFVMDSLTTGYSIDFSADVNLENAYIFEIDATVYQTSSGSILDKDVRHGALTSLLALNLIPSKDNTLFLKPYLNTNIAYQIDKKFSVSMTLGIVSKDLLKQDKQKLVADADIDLYADNNIIVSSYKVGVEYTFTLSSTKKYLRYVKQLTVGGSFARSNIIDMNGNTSSYTIGATNMVFNGMTPGNQTDSKLMKFYVGSNIKIKKLSIDVLAYLSCAYLANDPTGNIFNTFSGIKFTFKR